MNSYSFDPRKLRQERGRGLSWVYEPIRAELTQGPGS